MVVKQLEASAEAVAQHGFHADTSAVAREQLIGVLPASSMMMLELKLAAGESYFIAGVCDQDCGDLDLEIFDDVNGESVDEDVEDDDVPMLEFTAPRTGQYMLAVRMVKCEAQNCYFGLRIFRK